MPLYCYIVIIFFSRISHSCVFSSPFNIILFLMIHVYHISKGFDTYIFTIFILPYKNGKNLFCKTTDIFWKKGAFHNNNCPKPWAVN